MKTRTTVLALSLLFVAHAASAQVMAPYYEDPCEGGFVEVDPNSFEPTGRVWSYGVEVYTGIYNADYVSALSLAQDYPPNFVRRLCLNPEDFVADQFDWRLPTVAELQDAYQKGLFADPDLTIIDRPDIPRWTSETKGPRAYAVKLDNGEAILKHKESFSLAIFVRVIPGEDNGPGNGKGKNSK